MALQLEMKALRQTILTTSLVVVFLYGITNYYNGKYIWDAWIQDIEVVTPVYAEKIYLGATFRTFSNSWSNLFYVIVGIYSIFEGLNDHAKPKQEANYVQRFPLSSIMLGIGCIHLGIGSGLYHASLTKLGRQIDVASMYSPLLATININLGRWCPRITCVGFRLSTLPILSALAIILAYWFYLYKWQMDSAIVLPTLIILTYGCSIVDRYYYPDRAMNLKWMVYSFVSLLIGVACRVLDVFRKFSTADSVFQGHAFWHFFTSLAVYFMYLHHRSEPVPKSLQTYSVV